MSELSITIDQVDELTNHLRWAHGVSSLLTCYSEHMSEDLRNSASCVMHQIEDAQQILRQISMLDTIRALEGGAS